MIPTDDPNPYAPRWLAEIGEPEDSRSTSETARAVRANAIQQGVVLVMAALMLDGGEMFRHCFIAAVGSWVMTGLILMRRRRAPTGLDLILLRYGFWFVLIVLGIIVP